MNSFILETIAGGGYIGVFLLMALENIFPPVPSEVIMGYGGVLVAKGHFAYWPLLLIGTSGTLVGNFFWYWLGWRLSEAQLRLFIMRWGRWLTIDWRQFVAARKLFLRRGDLIVLLLRVSPFMRTLISLPAGVARMRPLRFAALTFVGSLVWNGVLIAGGGALAPTIERYEAVAGWIVGSLIALALGWYLWRVATWKAATG